MRALSRLLKFNYNVLAFQDPNVVIPPGEPLCTIEYYNRLGRFEKHTLFNQPGFKTLNDPTHGAHVRISPTSNVARLVSAESRQAIDLRYNKARNQLKVQMVFEKIGSQLRLIIGTHQ